MIMPQNLIKWSMQKHRHNYTKCPKIFSCFYWLKDLLGALLIGWKSDLLDIKAVEYGSFSITTNCQLKLMALFGGYPVSMAPHKRWKKGFLAGTK